MIDPGIQKIQSLSPKQLSMAVTREKVRQLPDVALPDGLALRGFPPGDEQRWVDLLNYGEFCEWDLERFTSYMLEPERTEGSRVVSAGADVVAAAFRRTGDDAASPAIHPPRATSWSPARE